MSEFTVEKNDILFPEVEKPSVLVNELFLEPLEEFRLFITELTKQTFRYGIKFKVK